jgi:Phage protein Gp138 N-terminal domain/GpV Apex motif
MSNPERFSVVLNDLINSSLMDVHTCVPARVVSVDYGTGYISAQPAVRTRVGVGKTLDYPLLTGVPLVINSGKSGLARITFPVSAGDMVMILFSERDPTSLLQSSGTTTADPDNMAPLGLYPIAAIPCISTASGAKPLSPTDVEIYNDKSKIVMKPDGSQKISNANGSVELKADGTIIQSAGAGKITMSPSGIVNINGFIISPDGKATSSTGISLETHRHTGVQTGTGTSGLPTI